MEYLKKRLRLLGEIKKDGESEGITKICSRVFCPSKNSMNVIWDLEKRGFISTEKTSFKIYSSLTEKGERLIKLLKELEDIWVS